MSTRKGERFANRLISHSTYSVLLSSTSNSSDGGGGGGDMKFTTQLPGSHSVASVAGQERFQNQNHRRRTEYVVFKTKFYVHSAIVRVMGMVIVVSLSFIESIRQPGGKINKMSTPPVVVEVVMS